MIRQRKIELLAPAKNLECGIAAVAHGADAIYICLLYTSMNVQTEVAQKSAAHRTALQSLLAMNGNMSLEFAETTYPAIQEINGYNVMRDVYKRQCICHSRPGSCSTSIGYPSW